MRVVARGGEISHVAEVSLVQDDRQGHGTNVPLGKNWGEFSVSLEALNPMWSSQQQHPDLPRLDHLTFMFGAWLYTDRADREHWIEIQSVSLIEKPQVQTVQVDAADAPIVLFSAALPRKTVSGRYAYYSTVQGMEFGSSAMRVSVDRFDPDTADATSFAAPLVDIADRWRDELAGANYVLLKARAVEPYTDRLELVLLEADGSPWGNMAVPLTTEWRTVKLPITDFVFFKHWRGPANRGFEGDHIRPENLAGINVCFGTWLYPGNADKPHAIEIEEISLSAQ